MTHPVRTFAVLALLAQIPIASAQDFTTGSTTGAQLKARFFPVEWRAPAGQSWGAIQADLVLVSRATIDEGTLVTHAGLVGGTNSRNAQGAQSFQTISIKGTGGTIVLNSASGPPSETLSISHSVRWDKARTIFTYPLSLAYDIDVSGVPGVCGTGTGCTVHYTWVVLPSRAAIAIDGIERPHPTLILRGARELNLASAGLSPFAEWASISLDGVVLTKIPFLEGYAAPPAGQWYRHPVRDGDAMRSGDPLRPTEVAIPSENGIEEFLSCGGGGCGTHGARIGLGDRVTPTGLHTLTLTTQSYAAGDFTFYGVRQSVGSGDPGDPAQLSTSFILFGPEIEVDPAEAGPGQTITIRGSGFAPNSRVRMAALISSSSRSAALGGADTDVTGSFTADAVLPPAGDPFFTEVIAHGSRPGTVKVDVDDPEFVAEYDDIFRGATPSDDAAVTFVATAVGPVSTTTTTTLPGGAPPPAFAVPACSATPVPSKAEQKFDKASDLVSDVEQLVLEQAAKKKLRRLIGKAQGALQRTRGIINHAKKKGLLSEGCSDAAIGIVDDLAARVQELRDGLKRVRTAEPLRSVSPCRRPSQTKSHAT